MTKEEFLNLETQRKESELSIPRFSAAHNINQYSYYHYRKKFIGNNKSAAQNNFIKLELTNKDDVKASEVSGQLELEMRTSFGTEMRLKGSITPEMLSAAIIASKEATNV